MPPLDHPYLRMGELDRLRHLQFSPRRPVEGLYAGRHRSRQRGHSVEFNDYRPYLPGDEIADIDWKVFGRTDRLYVKLFEHQSDMTVHLLVDGSASMGYQSADAATAISKYDQACRLAASIAFLTIAQQDRASFAIARHGLRHFHPPGRTDQHLHGILDAMTLTRLGGEADLPEAITRLAARVQRRGVIILLSDLLDDREATLSALSQFTGRGSEVIVFHVLHEHELKLPDLDSAVFVDSENAQRLTVNVSDVRSAYDTRLQEFLDAWSAGFQARGMDYNLVSTATPGSAVLQKYLFARAASG